MNDKTRQAALPLFVSVMFASAALIFVLQPMFARLTTPLLGGAAAVWNTSMVFFQAALLLGYIYAHAVARLPSLRTQLAVHGGVLLLGMLALPISVRIGIVGMPNPETPIIWLLGALTVSVGLPYAAASATAPLLQSWYARTGRPDAHDPYHLYAASNLGSFGGLLAYPGLIEPTFGLTAQRWMWSAMFVVVALGVVAAGLLAARIDQGAPKRDEATPERPSWAQRLFWVAAAAVPSSLLLGVTTHLTMDVASTPFLWVIPLSLYLLTFVIAFGKQADAWRGPVSLLAPISLAALAIAIGAGGLGLAFAVNIVCFFLAALVCHLALAERRPHAGDLTDFYLWVSVGGVLGGAATALLAPNIFSDVFEYPLALAAAALFLPRGDRQTPQFLATIIVTGASAAAILPLVLAPAAGNYGLFGLGLRRFWEPGVITFDDLGRAVLLFWIGLLAIAATCEGRLARHAAYAAAGLIGLLALERLFHAPEGGMTGLLVSAAMALFAVAIVLGYLQNLLRPVLAMLAGALVLAIAIMVLARGETIAPMLLVATLGVIAAGIFANRGRPTLAAILILGAFSVTFLRDREDQVAFQGRSFFGVTRVVDHPNLADGTLRVMMHGTTIHGAQYVDGPRSREPLTYYNSTTGLGQATKAAIAQYPVTRLGLIGLGSGSTACSKRQGDPMTIFEIDPMVVRFSTQTRIFTFVPQCAPDAKLVTGDARLEIEREPNGAFDVIVVDAFSSDSVPAHLLTREAIALYLSKTSPHGIVILHLSNRNLDLLGEASRVADNLKIGALKTDYEPSGGSDGYTAFSTTVLVLGRTQADVERLGLGPKWSKVERHEGRPWSDEYINLVRPLLSNF